MGSDPEEERDDEATMADRLVAASDQPRPGHPAEPSSPVPSPGEQLGRGGDAPAVPGDEGLVDEGTGDEPPPG